MQVIEELAKLGVAADAIDGILQALSLRSVEQLEALLGADCAAVADLRTLFGLAEAYGYADWLVFDASVVRGLAYYTGACVEGRRKAGEGVGHGGAGRGGAGLPTHPPTHAPLGVGVMFRAPSLSE